MEYQYVLFGDPIPLARARYTGRRVWDSQKEIKLVSALNLKQQHGKRRLLFGPLHFDVTFYMKMPEDPRKRKKYDGNYHFFRPDIDNMLKMLLDVANSVLYRDDCIVCSINARKIYDETPRTEIKIREMNNEKPST